MWLSKQHLVYREIMCIRRSNVYKVYNVAAWSLQIG